MTDDPNSEPTSLILEHLRQIREGQDLTQRSLREMKDEIMALRKQMHAIQGDGLRREGVIAALQVDLDRIKVRLQLNDA